MEKLAIVGLGLMGGSLGLAVRSRRPAAIVTGFARRPVTRRQALRRQAVTQAVGDMGDAVREADVVVLCLPVLASPPAVAACRLFLKPGCIVTDVGSTKAELVRECHALLKGSGARFVGSHPIAGSEETGMAAARQDLYEGAVVVVTPAPGRSERSPEVGAIVRFWRGIGAMPVVMSASEHDRLLARTSHLPHLTAAMLVNVLLSGSRKADALCGPGFRDATRVAAGSEEMWHDILKSNRQAIAKELGAFERVARRVRVMVERGDFVGLRRFLAESRRMRHELNGGLAARRTRR